MNARRPLIRRAYTLIELVIAMGSATVLLAGLSGAVLLSSRAFRPESTAQHARTDAAFAQRDLLVDLQLATAFTERTDKAATFLVPDRDGDGRGETLRYAWSGTAGDPVTFTYNGAAPATLLADVQDFRLSYFTKTVAAVTLPAEQTGSKILLIVEDSQNPTAEELSRKTLLESWNFAVTMLGRNDSGAALLAAAQASQAVYLCGSGSASSFPFALTLASEPVGIVNEHPDLVDELGFAASANTAVAASINVTDNTHYITTGLATGSNTIATAPSAMLILNSPRAVNLNTLATVSGTPALATVDPGKLLHDGRTAAGRRVSLCWGSGNFDPQQLNATGEQITLRAIEWATGLGNVSPELKNFGYEQIFASTQSGRRRIQLGTRVQLTERGTVKSITAYLGGSAAQVRFAIYSESAGEPNQLLVQTAVGASASSMAWVTLPTPDTTLDPGYYWLTFALANNSQRYRYVTPIPGAGERNRNYNAVANGFLSNWGTSNNSYAGARSIYATYLTVP